MIPFIEQRFTRSNADMHELCSVLAALHTPQEIKGFLQDLCTSQELTMFTDRWTIAKLIHLGFPYRVINKKTGASSSTIARVSQSLANGSGQLLNACKSRQDSINKKFLPPQ